MTATITDLDNPYWGAVKDHVDWSGRMSLWGIPLIDWCNPTGGPPAIRRDDFVSRYSWTIPDPDTVTFVAGHARGRVVDPMAGTGYWAKLLTTLGVDVVCYDQAPGTNHWHQDQPLHFEVAAMDAADAVVPHPDRTLLLSWPPYDANDGAGTVRAYPGNRIIFIGEGRGGCTGDDDLFDELAEHWTEVAEQVPVQWYGMHDVVTVYDRKVTS